MGVSAFRSTCHVVLLVAALLLAACGDTSASEGDDGGGGNDQAAGGSATSDQADGCGEQLQQMYDELEGLDWDERRETLVELAEGEDGPLMVYAASSQRVVEALIEEFTRLT